MGGHAQGNFEGPLMPMGKVPDEFILVGGETEIIQNRTGAHSKFCLIFSGSAAVKKMTPITGAASKVMGKDDILQRRHLFEKVRFLEGANNALPGHFMHPKMRNILSQKRNRPSGELQIRGDQIENRALSCPIWADERQDLPFMDVEVQPIDRRQPSEMFREVSHLKQSHVLPFLLALRFHVVSRGPFSKP